MGKWIRNKKYTFSTRNSFGITIGISAITLMTTGAMLNVARYAGGISWLLFFYSLDVKSINRLTDNIAENSFGIYLLHSPLVYITYTYFRNSNPVFVICLNLFWGMISFFLSSLIRRTKASILLGESAKT